MGFEIYVLAIVNELYFRRSDPAAALAEGRTRLQAKIAALRAFGARRAARARTRSSSSTSACAAASPARGRKRWCAR